MRASLSLFASTILAVSLVTGCGDDSPTGGGGSGAQGGGGQDTGGQTTGGQTTGGGGAGGAEAQPGDPCRDETDCQTSQGLLSCFLPGECNSGIGDCPGPHHCLPGEQAQPDGSCLATPCDPAAPQCPAASSCDASSSTCLPEVTSCAADADCPAGYACVETACREGCRVDGDCPSASEVCDAQHECVPAACATDADCGGAYCLSGGCYDALGSCDYPAA